jgi:hypothetical protein
VRVGPGNQYALLTQITSRDVFDVIGYYEWGQWWLLALPDGAQGWTYSAAVHVYGDTAQLPAVPAPPLPTGATRMASLHWTPLADGPCGAETEGQLSAAGTVEQNNRPQITVPSSTVGNEVTPSPVATRTALPTEMPTLQPVTEAVSSSACQVTFELLEQRYAACLVASCDLALQDSRVHDPVPVVACAQSNVKGNCTTPDGRVMIFYEGLRTLLSRNCVQEGGSWQSLEG